MPESHAGAWPELAQLIQASSVDTRVRPPNDGSATATTLALHDESFLGALATHTAGIVLDRGWLRILGGSSDDGFPGLDEANAGADGLLVVAFDVLGGVFAVDGGALGRGDGAVHHFSVDSLRWENLELGHAAFVTAMLGGATVGFYESLRWPGWQTEVQALGPGQGLSSYPFPFTAEGKDLARTSHRAVPFPELLGIHHDFVRQLDGADAPPLPPLPWRA